jgi:hypothetical protein
MDKFFEIKKENNRIVSIYYHKCGKHINDKLLKYDKHRVDGGTMFDYEFIKSLGFHIPKPNFINRNSVSSGVWVIVKDRIKYNKLITHRMEISLVIHDGNEDSKMHPILRKKVPIHSFDFKNNIK